MASSSTTMKVYAAIARALADNGVQTLFGLMGDGNLYVVDSYVRDCKGKFVSAANENGAALMALGFSSVSGQVGVATVTHGPAVSNTLTALIEGVRASLPMVLLCGDTPVEDKNHLQNVPQRELIAATGAGFEQLRSPGTLSEDIATAFRRTIIERRPIALNMPAEFMWLDVEYKRVKYRVPENKAIACSSADLDDAVGIIAAAKRPIIVAGRGALDAKNEIIRLARRIDAPLATTLKGKSLFEGEELDLGVFGTLSSPATVDTIMSSDTIIAFGASLNRYTTSHGAFVEEKRVIQVTLDQSAVGKYMEPTVALIGDAELAAKSIIHWLDEAEITPSGFGASLRGKIDRSHPLLAPDRGGREAAVEISSALSRLNDAIPLDRVFVTDAGRFTGQAWRRISTPDPRSLLFTINFGSIGLGLPYAIGAAQAAPNRPTLLVTGDGGFMLGGLAEFNSAVRSKADLIVIICNDGSYGSEYVQFTAKDMDPGMSTFEWPDFAPVADSLGGRGVTVRNADDLDAAVAAIKNRRGPLVIDLKLDPNQIPANR